MVRGRSFTIGEDEKQKLREGKRRVYLNVYRWAYSPNMQMKLFSSQILVYPLEQVFMIFPRLARQAGRQETLIKFIIIVLLLLLLLLFPNLAIYKLKFKKKKNY